jgi:auxin efflux carrier family protein
VLRKSGLKRAVIVAILCVRFVLLSLIGVAVVRVVYELGFLSHDPLYRYVLMVQFVVPPAMNIGTYAHGTLKNLVKVLPGLNVSFCDS